MLLARPHWPWDGHRIETINDADGFVSNFWRALQAEPEAVARWADWPVNECDLHARHLWLVNTARQQLERLKTDPEFYDCKVAGWWVWGCCQWIGSGWCHHPEWEQLPHLGDAGRGIHRPSQKRPHLGNAGRRFSDENPETPAPGQRGYGHPSAESETPSQLYEYLGALADRVARVRVCCGDWSRVCGPTPTVKQGLTAVFLDPPYADEADRKAGLYARDSNSIAHEVREWALEWGNDKRMRIALCGYEGEHVMPDSWKCVPWKARGGYGSQGNGETNGRENSTRERIWFSQHCLRPNSGQRSLPF